MKITILCENTSSDIGCLAEWGFSAFIEHNDVNVLFDTGYSDVYLKNAKRVKINLENTHFIVFSHFHSDHTRGLQYHLFKSHKKLILHPEVIEKLPKSEAEKIEQDFEIVSSNKPLEFSKDIYYLGEIPRINDFERGEVDGDKMRDDSALAIKTRQGVVVISGCSHAGICNIAEYAKKVTGQKLYAVVGGFHLFEKDLLAVNGTIDYFKSEKPKHILPMHCVDFPTLTKFHKHFGCIKYSSGDEIIL